MRLVHQGFCTLQIEDDIGKSITIDPHGSEDAPFIALTGSPWPERYAGLNPKTHTAISATAECLKALNLTGSSYPHTLHGFHLPIPTDRERTLSNTWCSCLRSGYSS